MYSLYVFMYCVMRHTRTNNIYFMLYCQMKMYSYLSIMIYFFYTITYSISCRNDRWIIWTLFGSTLDRIMLQYNSISFSKFKRHLKLRPTETSPCQCVNYNSTRSYDEAQNCILIGRDFDVETLWSHKHTRIISVTLAPVLREGQICIRAYSRFPPSQWETALLCNDVSHWLGASLESALCLHVA